MLIQTTPSNLLLLPLFSQHFAAAAGFGLRRYGCCDVVMRVIGIRTTVPICLSICSSSHPFHSVRLGNILPFYTCRRHIHELSRTQSLFVRPITLSGTTILQNRPDNPPPPPSSPLISYGRGVGERFKLSFRNCRTFQRWGKGHEYGFDWMRKKEKRQGKKNKKTRKTAIQYNTEPSPTQQSRLSIWRALISHTVVDIISEKW